MSDVMNFKQGKTGSMAVAFFALTMGIVSLSDTSNANGQTVQTAAAEQGSFRPEEFTDARFKQYEQQLNAILKTRRDEEKAFVNQVVNQVRQGKIPAQIVQTSFHWVHQKRPNTNFPFIYFERVLRIQTEQIGLGDNLPTFDFSIYRAISGTTRTGALQR